MAMMIGDPFPRLTGKGGAFKNEGTAAKLATATPDDFKKNLRVTAMIFLRTFGFKFLVSSLWFLVSSSGL